jgi:hypothetical protein
MKVHQVDGRRGLRAWPGGFVKLGMRQALPKPSQHSQAQVQEKAASVFQRDAA